MQGHNRWHPDVTPAFVVAVGDEVTLDAPLGTGTQIGPSSTHKDLLTLDLSGDLLAGPVLIEGVEPGDLLVVDVVDVEPGDFGFSMLFPGFGLLGDLFTEPYLLKWHLEGGYASSDALPGVSIPAAPFPGTIGVAPSHALMDAVQARETEIAERAGFDLTALTVPAVPASLVNGLSTLPPRENGGNLDVRHMGIGARLLFPVHVAGALLSLGDVHYTQGDGEVCGSAIEIGARVTIRIGACSGARWTPRFPAYETAEERPRRYIATTGISLDDDGRNELLDIGLSARRALLELLDYLTTTYGFTREAAYVLASVAADLRISAAVDLPNALVSALLPIDIFESYRSPA